MPLPNAERAVVDSVKLRNYCLNAGHPEGKHKARVFLSALGMTAADAESLAMQFLSAAAQCEAAVTNQDAFGQRYVVDVTVRHGTRQALVRTAWIVRNGEDFPRLTSCYVL